MTNILLENISKDLLRWAFQRAGFSKEHAICVFPLLDDWLNDAKRPTLSQLRKYADYFHAPLGFLFLKEVPMESLPFPVFGSPSEATDYFDLDVYDTAMGIGRRQDGLEDYLLGNEIEKYVSSLGF